MKTPVFGIQLYTLRDYIQTAEDFDNTLARLAKMGIHDVQISAIGDIPAEIQRDILNKYSMQVCITHKPIDRMKNDLDNLLHEHEIIGCHDIGIGCAPSDARDNSGAVRAFIKDLNAIGENMAKRGFHLYYHNHAFEFYRLADMNKCMMDLLLAETNPEYVGFIPDVAWADYGGQNPVELLEKMKGRVKVIHFKDYMFDENSVRRFVPLTKGVVDLKACYDAACRLEIPYIMYEHDDNWPDGDAFKACEETISAYKKLTDN
jgi:sugar phosphate isomerase/epimerase